MEDHVLADLCADLVWRASHSPRVASFYLQSCRFILPILGEYSDAGYHEPNDRLRYSLRQNAQFYAICLGVSIVGLVYVIIVYRLSFDGLKGIVVALAYCWGLFLAIYLMGHGLVSIPRRLIRSFTISGRLRRLQIRAPKVHEHMEDSLISLEELEAHVAELARRKTGTALDHQDWIEELQEMANMLHNQPPPATSTIGAQSRTVPSVITEKYLAELTRHLDHARHSRTRYVDEWTRLVQEAGELQAILDSAASKKLDFGQISPRAGFFDRVTILTPYTRYLYYYYLMPYFQAGLGVLLAIASACIVWSELARTLAPNLSIIRFTVIHHWVGDSAEVGFAGQVVSAFWICYMCAAALISMTEVKVWRGRALVKRNTAYESAFWYAMQVAKLCIPLSYNYVTFLSEDVYKKMTFFHFLGKLIEFNALGRWFDDIFPIVVLLPVVATMFGLYGRVKRVFVGIDVIDDDDEDGPTYGTGSWREGRDLIAQELGGNPTYRRRGDTITRVARSGGAGGRSAPVLSVPPLDSPSSPGRSPVRGGANIGRPGPPVRVSIADELPEDDNMFTIIGHRMKNTIDNIEAPKWFQEIGQGMKKPKWMGNNDEAGGASGSGQSNTDIRRWFGKNDGHIRL